MKGQNTTLNCDVGNIQILLRFARWKDSQRLSHVETPPNAAIISAGCEGDKNAQPPLNAAFDYAIACPVLLLTQATIAERS